MSQANKTEIKLQMHKARAELLRLSIMLREYPFKQKEVFGAVNILTEWIDGISKAALLEKKLVSATNDKDQS